MEEITIRDATIEDAGRILEIYSYYIKNTAVTFEYDVTELSKFQERMNNIMESYPYLVIETDKTIMGYAYAKSFVGRAAYDWSCEVTVYVDCNAQKCGLGSRLYEELENRLKQMGILNMYARIAYPETEDEYLNRNSAKFHSRLGFKKVGEYHKCGYKFYRWYDMICMEKIIGEHNSYQGPVNLFHNRRKS